jgi:hypothetical protein
MEPASRPPREPGQWLAVNPAPIRAAGLPRWQAQVRSALANDFAELLVLLVGEDDEASYQAMAAIRAFGHTAWGVGSANDEWEIELTSGGRFRVSALG